MYYIILFFWQKCMPRFYIDVSCTIAIPNATKKRIQHECNELMNITNTSQMTKNTLPNNCWGFLNFVARALIGIVDDPCAAASRCF